MRVSELFGRTNRKPHGNVESESHQLLDRAGFVRQIASGIYSLQPLALRSLRKIEMILREEVNKIGGQEILMPIVHPAKFWRQSGRWESIDESLVRFQDRKGSDLLLAMTHEEIATFLASSEIKSYRDLPRLIYQIQTKFRDEARPRGGLIRTREFVMKDSYSFDVDEQGLEKQYRAHFNAYFRIGARVGVPLTVVGSDSGIMGGKRAHEFMYITPIGEDTLVVCDKCGYAANIEVARSVVEGLNGGKARKSAEVFTPEVKTIVDLAAFLGIDKRETLKTLAFVEDGGVDRQNEIIVVSVRGDMEVNWASVARIVNAQSIRPAREDELTNTGFLSGYGSPVGLQRGRAIVVLDETVSNATNLVAGANKENYHLRDVCPSRDIVPNFIRHVSLVREGDACCNCNAALRLTRGVEVGNIFNLGTRYSKSLNASFAAKDGEQSPLFMGSYGIGVGRLLACIAEANRDKDGLVFPVSVAPYEVSLVSLVRKDRSKDTVLNVYESLDKSGIEVLFDDRDVTPGVKFFESDLRGMPIRLTISERLVDIGRIELKLRNQAESVELPIKDIVSRVRHELDELYFELEASANNAADWDSLHA